MNRMIRLMKLPDKPSIPGLRQMERKDCTKAWTLLSEYLKVCILVFLCSMVALLKIEIQFGASLLGGRVCALVSTA